MSEPKGPHPADLGLAAARVLVQRAVDKAEQLGLRGAVAVVGASGTLLTASDGNDRPSSRRRVRPGVP